MFFSLLIGVVLSSTALVKAPDNSSFIFVNARLATLTVYKVVKHKLSSLRHFAVSLAKNSGSKKKEGDKKTPQGVYLVNDYKGRAELDYKYYGVGAWSLNYPNPIDIKFAKTGHGIWIHGASTEGRLESPRVSNGCIVLSNFDFNTLMRYMKKGRIVIIADLLEYRYDKKLSVYFKDKKIAYTFRLNGIKALYKQE